MKDKNKVQKPTISNLKRNRWFIGIIIIFTLVLYGNSSFNYFSMDDHYISADNPMIKQGISAIPEIFTSLYAEESDMTYGYRPLVRSSFAIEYEFFNGNPYISHFFNIIFYLLAGLLLFIVLKRLFKDYNVYFPFVITLLFLAFPMHTEVVASLKNRDEVFNLIFCLLALQFFIKWVDLKKTKFLIFGLIFYLLAFLSKQTALAFLLIFPLALYFYTDIKLKNLYYFIGAVIGVVIIEVVLPTLYLPEISREVLLRENPLVADHSFFERIATGLYILGFYLKKLFYPFPMLYYYGYNMITIKTFANAQVIISLIVYLGMFVFAIKKFKEKHILSFAILFYLITIAMFANIVKPIPGIVGDRFLLIPSLAFAIAVSWFVFKLFKLNPEKEIIKKSGIIKVLVLVVIILIPYSALTFSRNKDWRTYYSLYKHDMKYLDNSVKAHNLLATEMIRQVNIELQKPVNVMKFVKPKIKRAIKHFERAIEIYPEHFSSYNNLGTIYSRMFKEYKKAIPYYKKAINLKPTFPNPYFNLGFCYEMLKDFELAEIYYLKSVEMDYENPSSRSRLANMNFKNGNTEKAFKINNELMEIAPESDLPYINFGNYYMMMADTAKAFSYFEKAAELSDQPNVAGLLSKMYKEMGDHKKAVYYHDKALETEKRKKEKKSYY